MKEVGLYLHVPFCNQKCHYCDFNSVPWQQPQGTKFLSAVKKELRLLAEEYSVNLKTLFLGGGTPTVFSGRQIASLINQCRQEFNLVSKAEITVEANPETVTEKKLKVLKEAGVNRLSFGVQALNNFSLTKLGRCHTVSRAVDSYYLARRLGYSNLNLDLMFALPGQLPADWCRTLEQVCRLKPEHLSCYNLKLEPGTRMHNWAQQGELDLASEEQDLAMYQLAQELLADAGYQQYEISNFAQPGFECRHNRIYWLNQPYLAVGPGAHFYDGAGRGYNYADLNRYFQALEVDNLPIKEYNKLSWQEKVEETMMLGLRLEAGISLTEFEERYDCAVDDIYQSEIAELSRKNLIKQKQNRLFLTQRGKVVANRVLAKFLLS